MVERSPALLHERFIAEFTALEEWEQNQILSSLQRVASMIGTPMEISAPLLSIAPLPGQRRHPHGSAIDSKTDSKHEART